MARTLRTSSRRLLTETLRSVPSEFVEEFDTRDPWCDLAYLGFQICDVFVLHHLRWTSSIGLCLRPPHLCHHRHHRRRTQPLRTCLHDPCFRAIYLFVPAVLPFSGCYKLI
ncbi:hypothetical protein QJS04_geneDACA022394 [Acorus gramineus]|uniref:Uncharacterized protein n=1 Tax=Acorus gramineus TaxID=55184 RepID=A0AAV9BUI3_ACOGR|nr:hypothetical protein QJS04_geneDACA022394 [Acorus gramineus]